RAVSRLGYQTSVMAPSSSGRFSPRYNTSKVQKEKRKAFTRVPTPLNKTQKVFMQLPEINCPHCPQTFEETGDFEDHYASKHAFGDGVLPRWRGCNRTFEEQKGLVYHGQDCDLGKEAHFIFLKKKMLRSGTAESGSSSHNRGSRQAPNIADWEKGHNELTSQLSGQYSSCNLKGFYVPDECSSPT